MLIVLLAALGLASAGQPRSEFKVYVFTAASAAFSDQLETARQEAVKLLEPQIEKKKALTIVDDPARADLQVEVLAAGKKDWGASAQRPP
jgi:hypothetical protein